MKKTVKYASPSTETGTEECCTIAENMMEEIHHIMISEGLVATLSGNGKPKESLKKRLLKQIKQAKILANVGGFGRSGIGPS